MKEVAVVHPFYGPSSVLLSGGSSVWIGLASMLAYLFFWGVVILIAYRLFLKHFRGYRNLDRPDQSLIILRERYAGGEIDREEFLEKLADLTAPGSAPDSGAGP